MNSLLKKKNCTNVNYSNEAFKHLKKKENKMVKISKNILFTLLLTTISSIVAVDTVGNSYFLGHTGDISGNGLLHEAGRAHKTNKDIYYCGNLHVEYNQNFDRKSLGNYLFFNGTNSMIVGPRRNGTTTNETTDFNSTNLLLPNTFSATATILPKVQTATINLSGSAHLNHLMKGLHLSWNLPLVYTKHDMQLTETANTDTSATKSQIAKGVITNTAAAMTPTNKTITQAFQGASLDGDVNTAMKYGKINGEQHHFRPGNATIAVGYDAIQREDYHLGFSVLGLINGGKRSNAEYWFEEGIGTAGRHGAGARLDAHKKLYQKDKNTVTGYLKADLIHAFGANVLRTYDYTANGVGSRYILVKEFTAANAYNNILHYGTNISTLQAKIGIPLLYNINAMLRWEHGKTSINVGYQLWGHNQEKHYGWKTTMEINKYGFLATTTTGNIAAAVATAATAGNGAGVVNDGNSLDVQVSGNTVGTVAAQVTSTRTIKTDDLNKASALAPSARSHKVFANLSRCCAEHENMPFVGIGGSAELSGKDNNTTDQWGVFVNGGFCF